MKITYVRRSILKTSLPTGVLSPPIPLLQKIGSDWINSLETLMLKVPSAVIPYEYNFIINTEHPAFNNKVHLARTEEYFWDSRLL